MTAPGGLQEASLPDEALRVSGAADADGLALRVTGGVAVRLRCPSAAETPLARTYADLDVVGGARDAKRITQLLTELGYLPDAAFNTLHGSRRLYFWDPVHSRQLDVFVDRVVMCHEIDLRKRLAVPGPTLSLADLLLMKLQIIETNEKDLQDILALLVDHDLTEDDEGINVRYLAELTAGDWGLWRTVTMIAERADHHGREMAGFHHRDRVHEQVIGLLERLEAAPKTRGWKLRAKVGERKRWYELPEEAH